MKEISVQTKSFIILTALAFFGVCFCLLLWTDLVYNFHAADLPDGRGEQLTQTQSAPKIDSSAWPSYSSEKYGLNFKYPPEWKILPAEKKGGFTVLQLDPGKQYYNVKIYISPKEFYIFDGLPFVHESIGGADALNVHNALYGVKANGTYYTFDVGLSMSLLPYFDALVHSVRFVN